MRETRENLRENIKELQKRVASLVDQLSAYTADTSVGRQVEEPEGIKHDQGKTRFDLIPAEQWEDIAKVITHGAEKYEDDNWQAVVRENPHRYYGALLRHVCAWRKGERLDPESGLPHLAHAGCCLLFLAWCDSQEEGA